MRAGQFYFLLQLLHRFVLRPDAQQQGLKHQNGRRGVGQLIRKLLSRTTAVNDVPSLTDKQKTSQTYTLSGREGDVTELLEEKGACNGGDQIHDQVVVHHAPRIQLQAFEVVRGEQCRQLRAAEGFEGGKVSSALKDEGKRHGRSPGELLLLFSSLDFLFCRTLRARLGWKRLNW